MVTEEATGSALADFGNNSNRRVNRLIFYIYKFSNDKILIEN
jgi:hypothetical protein